MRSPGLPGALALFAAVSMAAGACARPGNPPGGDPDEAPPAVVATRPDTFAQVDAIDDPIRMQFNERISERPSEGTLNDAVVVSPRTGEVRVDHEGDALEVDLSTGVQSGLVYRVTLLPVIRDLFGNVMREPFEFAFTTGGEFHPTALAGFVLDRIDGTTVEDAWVHLEPDWTDSLELTYLARTDTSGIFAFRFLPPGRYRMQAFQDRDRDGEVDEFEVQGARRVLVGAADTVAADVVVLPPDTSAARLAQAEVDDSITLRLTFDDYLDPLDDPDDAGVELEALPDTLEDGEVVTGPAPPEVERVVHGREWDRYLDSLRAVQDSLEARADSAAADTAGAPGAAPDTVEAGPPEQEAVDTAGAPGARTDPGRGPGPGGGLGRPGQERSTLPDGTPLPSRDLVVRLAGPLPAGFRYGVTVQEVRNINGLSGGGGTVDVRRPVPTDTAVADTAAVDSLGGAGDPGDPLGVPPDTAGTPRDTADALPDTAGAPPDTAGSPPDTVGAVPAMGSSDAHGDVRSGAGDPPHPGVPRRPRGPWESGPDP